MIKEVISIFFNLSLAFFTVASTILAMYSINNRLRLRKVRVSWRTGKLNGFPLFSSLFLVFSFVLAIVMLIDNNVAKVNTMVAYLWLSTMWFISSYLASKSYITDHGIVKNINEPSQTIAWYEIIDFAENTTKHGTRFSFMYKEDQDSSSIHKLGLSVPDSKIDSVKKIVSYKIEKRLEGDISKIIIHKENN